MSELSVLVVGAGVGGLACAIDLAARGVRVTVLEKESGPGGKAGGVTVGGREMDRGAVTLTSPEVFDGLFDRAGADFRAAVPLSRATLLDRHVFVDGSRFDRYADPARAADEVGRTFGARDARAYRRFLDDARKVHAVAEDAFLSGQRRSLPALARAFGPAGLATMARLDGLRSLASSLRKRFADPRLRRVLGGLAVYCGASPFEAPATLQLIAHVEARGVHRPVGGMRSLVGGLVALARSLGVEVETGVRVERVRVDAGRVSGADTSRGPRTADAVVFNGDVAALGAGLVGVGAARGSPRTAPDERSLSAVSWAMVARVEAESLAPRNIVYGADERAEFDAILRRAPTVEQPSVYLLAQDRADEPGPAPEEERLLVLVNAPASGDEAARWGDEEKERCTRNMQRGLHRAGWAVRPRSCVQTTPADYARRYPGTGGGLYGPRWRGTRAVLGRAAAATSVPGLYRAGGSVHPGPSLPLAAQSGCLAAAQILEDRASLRRSRTGATSGTTSTD